MQCPSCGAISKKRSLKCSECGAFRNKSSLARSRQFISSQTTTVETETPAQEKHSRQTRSLIEFPGAKHSMPQWRKELGERVREVQERRLRENTLEDGSDEVADRANAPLLELLPQAEVSPLNPVVAAALARIERAHVSAQPESNYANFGGVNAVVAYAEQPEFSSEQSLVRDSDFDSPLETESQESAAQPERTHNLAVVPNPPTPLESKAIEVDPSPNALKAKRLIGDDVNHPALNYLDTIPTAVTADDCPRTIAPIHLRIFSSFIDLVIVGLLSWLPLALAGLTNLAWHDRRALVLALITIVVVAFLYSTICTALTGQTLGMKLFSLRVIDARTRMLPTGKQSAARAAVYILSVALTGLPLIYTFIDRDKHAVHDRFTSTEVVRM